MYASELSLNRSQPANLEMTQPCLTSLAPRILAQSRRSPEPGRPGLHPTGRAQHCTERTGGVVGANGSGALKTPRWGKNATCPFPRQIINTIIFLQMLETQSNTQTHKALEELSREIMLTRPFHPNNYTAQQRMYLTLV